MPGAKEKVIDAKTQVYSFTSLIAVGWLTPLALFNAGLAIQRDGELWLGLLHGIWKRISMETFRVLVDVTFVLSVLCAAVTPTSLVR